MITEQTYQSNNEIKTILNVYHVNDYNNIAKQCIYKSRTTDNETIIQFRVSRRYCGKALTIIKRIFDDRTDILIKHGAKQSYYFIPKTELNSEMIDAICNDSLRRCKPVELRKTLKEYVCILYK